MSFTTKFLHFDSANSNYITDINNSSTIVRNPFKAQYTMNQTFRKVKRVYLSSVEFPVGFSNVRTGSCDTLKYILNGTAYTVVLPEKNTPSRFKQSDDYAFPQLCSHTQRELPAAKSPLV